MGGLGAVAGSLTTGGEGATGGGGATGGTTAVARQASTRATETPRQVGSTGGGTCLSRQSSSPSAYSRATISSERARARASWAACRLPNACSTLGLNPVASKCPRTRTHALGRSDRQRSICSSVACHSGRNVEPLPGRAAAPSNRQSPDPQAAEEAGSPEWPLESSVASAPIGARLDASGSP